jgi:hypothetical protein
MNWAQCVLLASVCIFGSTRAEAQRNAVNQNDTSQADIQGEYQYESWNAAENKTYKGPVTITKKGDYYHISYDNGQGSGVAIRKGNTLSVSYVYSDKPDYWGLQVFDIEKSKEGPRLVGEYTTHPGNGKLGKDTWTFVKPLK